MKVERGAPNDIDAIMELISEVVSDMWVKGVDQWDEDYPSRAMLEDDLARGALHLVRDGDAIEAIIVLDDVQDEEYAKVQWRTSGEKVFVVHRLAVRPRSQGKGLGGALMDYAERHAKSRGYKVMRLDAYTVNPAAVALYARRGYIRAGEVRYPRRKYAFNCYEKVL